ncbi:hypothetical protein AB9K34_11415 [Sedimentitalea sp. XS_ASV28]|uniref:hypothetical protein n=1 Tax=Sedimentitalea sp. XS_ASV28 TaxID=3241296 RepID=UPI0035119719
MKTAIRLALVACLACLPSWGAAWWSFNRLEVFPVSETAWEVVAGVGTGAADYWCGAGDFAQRVLGVSAASRIYIWKSEGPSVNRPGRKAVQFSMSPPSGADTSTGYSLSVKRAGDNLARHAAVQYCYQFDESDIWNRW